MVSLTRGRPAETWTLTLMYAAGSAGCLLAAVFPMSGRAPVGLIYLMSAVGAVVALGVWTLGTRSGRVMHLAVALKIALVSLLVAQSATPQGAVVTAFAYLWVAVYAAHFLERRAAWLYSGLITVGYAVAMAVNEPTDSISAYVIVVATIWVAVTVLSNLVNTMRAQAVSDQLTGLLNRAGFRAAAEREQSLAARTGSPLSLAVIDLDDFKSVNDRDGHEGGDRVLVELAARWSALLRRSDVLGRYGGDEFVLLMPATDGPAAQVALARLRVDSPIAWSSGVAQWVAGESLDECLARADRVLYADKALGRVPRPRAGQVDRSEPLAH